MKNKLTTLLLVFAIVGCSVNILIADENKKENAKNDESVKKIDLDKQPWLAESANLLGGTNQPERPRMIWANSVKYQTINEIVNGTIEIEYWANKPPKDFTGKFVLIEVWATWCPACRRNLPLLEFFQKKYENELAVISICETDKNELEKMESKVKFKDMKASVAVDTKRRLKETLGATGIPHAILIEPIKGAVLWEGMPTQINYELSDEIMAKYISLLKNPKVAEKLPKEAPFKFKEDKKK
ncbi:MAG: TlpA family protein disulfide reductase [Planctomycetaceae bacterium]|jgi:thiol-disulfide isomerase/thioredoxin|nr:TlpA family protein disulfide reductase [Planctomycetaceae bacterium]